MDVNPLVYSVYKEEIGYDDLAIYRTIRIMYQLIVEASKNPYIRGKAEEIIQGVAAYDKWMEAEQVFNFVQQQVVYTEDPAGWEYIQRPEMLLQKYDMGYTPRADCDDMTVLGLSLLRSIGFDVAMKITTYQAGAIFSHVYGLIKIDGQWVPFDTIRKEFELGDEAPNIQRASVIMIENDLPLWLRAL